MTILCNLSNANEARMKNRWAVAAAGTVVMICLGTVYSWSLFTDPLIASFNWTSATTTWTFSVAIFFLGVGAIIGGRWQDQSGPRPVVVTGSILWGVGNILAGLGTARFGAWWIYLTYGFVGGLGLGLAYITPVATVTMPLGSSFTVQPSCDEMRAPPSA